MPTVTYFDAQIVVLELLEHKPILTGGYKAVWTSTQVSSANGYFESLFHTYNHQSYHTRGHGVVWTCTYSTTTMYLLIAVSELDVAVEECEVIKLLAALDPKTKERKKVGNAFMSPVETLESLPYHHDHRRTLCKGTTVKRQPLPSCRRSL